MHVLKKNWGWRGGEGEGLLVLFFLKLQAYTFNGRVIADSSTLFIFLMLHRCFIIGMNMVMQCML